MIPAQWRLGLMILSSLIGCGVTPGTGIAQIMVRRLPGSMATFQITATPNMRPLTNGRTMMNNTGLVRPPLPSAFNSSVRPNGFGNMNPAAFGPFTNPFGNALMNPYLNPLAAYGNPYSAALTSANPYGGYGSSPYGNYGQYPPGGYNQGYGGVDYSEGKLMKDAQEASLTKEKVRQAKLDNQRREVENWLWNRDHLPTVEDDRQRAQRELLKRSLSDPPEGDIYSGQALNVLLADLAGTVGQSGASPGEARVLDADIVRHINVTSGQGQGNPGLLKDGGRIPWPAALKDALYQANRNVLDHLGPVVYAQAITGHADAGALQQVEQAVQELRRQVVGNIRDITPAQYTEAKRFLGHLDDGLRLLHQPNAGMCLTAFAARGTTVEGLVRRLLRLGWYFAPAVPGDEGAYVAVHRALAAYDLGMRTPASSEAGEKEYPQGQARSNGY
jgi:hypothetical protein